MKTYTLLCGLSFLLSVILTPLVRKLAHHFRWLDQPGKRKVHQVPIPRLGGVAIFLASGLAFLSLLLVHNRITTLLRIQWFSLSALPVAIVVIFLLGLLDDIVGVSPYVKLVVEVACSLWVFFHGVFIGLVTNPAGKAFDVGIWSLPLTVFWLVGITNAFNLVDGIDGLAAGIALFGMATLALISLLTGNTLLIAVLAGLGGATAGFLLFNFHPASIFLGDSGSLLLGFSLAALSLLWAQKSTLAVAVVGPILIFGLPIADTALALVRRFVSGAPIFTSDSDHIHHRLLRLGLSPRKVVLLLYAACVVFSLMTLFFVHVSAGVALFVLIFLLGTMWIGLSQLGYHELAEINLTIRRALLTRRTIISQNVHLRRAADLVGEANDIQELWIRIIAAAKAFDFEHVKLSLSPEMLSRLNRRQGSSTASVPVWRYWSDGAEAEFVAHPERFWRIEIPLGNDYEKGSCLVFYRTFEKGGLDLAMDFFVGQLSSSVSKCLGKFQDVEAHPLARLSAAVSASSKNR